MTRDEKKALITARMFNGEPFTAMQLANLAGLDLADFRLADGLIQKHRKAGKIAYSYERGSPVWRMTTP